MKRSLSALQSSWAVSSRSFLWACHGFVCCGLLTLTHPVPGQARERLPPQGAVASAHPLATAAGLEILEAGGNAFDAAVAVAAALAVVEPFSSGLGGGGFWLLHHHKSKSDVMIDARETAPNALQPLMYVDPSTGNPNNKSVDGPLAAGIPGVPAGLDLLARHYGRLTLPQVLAPAVRLARQGFPATPFYRFCAAERLQALRQGGAAGAIFLVDGNVPPVGHLIVQHDLAITLERFAARGAHGFYGGLTAADLVGGVRQAGGLWHLLDLANYQVKLRSPLTGHYRNVTITTAAPPSAGGVALIDALHILSSYNLPRLTNVERTHLTIEAMRRAYADRAEYLGDPDYNAIPVSRLTSESHATAQRASIRMQKATPSAALSGAEFNKRESGNTTHYSVLDREGNRVAATLSINFLFGSGFVPPGTGVLLNDEMDDFAPPRGAGNLYGLVGGQANALAAGKRPLSSMTPTFLESGSRLGILGTPGGSRITTMVLLGALEFVAGKLPEAWVTRPRFHHQWLPDRVEFEPGALNETELSQLRQRGHVLSATKLPYGNMQAILWDKANSRVYAASDPRGEGAARLTPASGGNHSLKVRPTTGRRQYLRRLRPE